MLYYPRQAISETSHEGGVSWVCNFELSDMLGFDECDAEYEALGKINSDSMERTFATPASQCMQLPQQNSSEFPSVAPSKTNPFVSPLAKEPKTSPTASTGSPTIQSTILPQPYEQPTSTDETVIPKSETRTSTNDRQTSSVTSCNNVLVIISTVAVVAFT